MKMGSIEVLRKKAGEANRRREKVAAELKAARERVRQLQDEWVKASAEAAEARATLIVAEGKG
jgi:ElaB/YqjD/DUF883 family membrane-anchored ribosome-binding protein